MTNTDHISTKIPVAGVNDNACISEDVVRVDRPAGLVTVTFPPAVSDAPAASKEIVAAVEKLVNGKFKVRDAEWTAAAGGGEIRLCKFAVRECRQVHNYAKNWNYARDIGCEVTVLPFTRCQLLTQCETASSK